jgi:hypothetical protein
LWKGETDGEVRRDGLDLTQGALFSGEREMPLEDVMEPGKYPGAGAGVME